MKFFAQIPIFHIFQQMESFWKSGEYLWWYSIFSDTCVQLESGKFRIFPPEKSFHLTIAKHKIAAPMKFLAQIPIFHIFQRMESFFENRLNTFGDIAFFVTQCTAWKREISNFSTRKKFSPYHCKTKIAAPMKFFARIPIFHIFQQKESFWKSGEYLWWYSIFSDTVYSLKVGNFEFFHQKKVFTLPWQN